MKQCRIFTQWQAKEDTDEIWHYIAQDNPEAAEAFLDAIEETSKQLSVFPATGGLRYFYHTELHGLRILPLPKFEKYLVFYRFHEDEQVVEIVRIVHGARDLPSFFDIVKTTHRLRQRLRGCKPRSTIAGAPSCCRSHRR